MVRATLKHRSLRYEASPPLAWVTLGRPGSDNLVDLLMTQELGEVADLLQQQPEVRVLVVTGAGKVFSRGREPLPDTERESGGDAVGRWMRDRRAACVLASLAIPVVAAINGDAVDHGLELALACDLRIASKTARLGVTDVSRGQVPWDGATQRLPRLVGRGRALDMLLTSRLVPADEALEMGLVNAVVGPDHLMEEAHQAAETLASGAPVASRYAKEAVLGGADMSLEHGLRLEADLNILLHSTQDRAIGIESFLHKTVPQYQGR